MKQSRCETCIHSVAIFGAHRGGVYCQVEYPLGTPRILYDLFGCEKHKPDEGKPHIIKFSLDDYPELFSEEERKKRWQK